MYMRYGTIMKKLEVMMDHKAVSNGLIMSDFSSCFLQAFILKFTPMKNAPMIPPTTPMMMAPTMSW